MKKDSPSYDVEGEVVGWIVAWVVIAVAIAVLCAAAVGSPVLYGLFVSTLLVGLARLLYWFFSGVAGDLFGRRKF